MHNETSCLRTLVIPAVFPVVAALDAAPIVAVQ